MASFFFRAYGLTIVSDVAIPGLSQTASALPDVRLHVGDRSDAASPVAQAGPEVWGEGGDPDHQPDAVSVRSVEAGAGLLVAYGDGMRFFIRRSGDEIWAAGPRRVSLETMATYLLGPIFGLVLRLRGTICLHASAVAVDAGAGSGAVAIVGPAGAGKSTIAAAFALRGHPVVSDDIAALVRVREHWAVEPAPPSIRLWDDSVTMLFGNPAALPLMARGWAKRQLDLGSLPGASAIEDRLPFVAAYILDRLDRPSDRVVATRLTPRDALVALVANTYANVLLDRHMRAAEFQALSSVVSAVPVWKIQSPLNAADLEAFCEGLTHGTYTTGLNPATPRAT